MTEVTTIIDLYYKTYKELLAIPVIKGLKTDNERFAGAMCTYTVEAFISDNGKAVQAATAHCLGQKCLILHIKILISKINIYGKIPGDLLHAP